MNTARDVEVPDIRKFRDSLDHTGLPSQWGITRPTPAVLPFKVGKTEVEVYNNMKDAGRAAAFDDIAYLLGLTTDYQKPEVNLLVARARSQHTRWAADGGLSDPNGLGRMFPYEQARIAFMDEFWGQSIASPGSLSSEFRQQVPAIFLKDLKFQEVRTEDDGLIEHEVARYSSILRSRMPFDLVMAGFGTGREDGTGAHMAFMDPPWACADRDEPNVFTQVRLPEWCRVQQMNDFGPTIYPNIDAVPKYALSVTMSTILSANRISCLVVGPHKAKAVKVALTCTPSEENPAALIRNCNSTLYVDSAAAEEILEAIEK